MEYLKIRNWEKWQTYRSDRGQPPWIKIHRCLMRDPDWVSLSDAQRGQLVAMWLLAADHNGAIPASTDVIKRLCYLENAPDINLFINLGFIENDATAASMRRQHDQPETEAEAEKRQRQSSNLTVTCVNFARFWEHWPVKRDRKRAQDVWRRKKLDAHADELIEDVKTRLEHDKKWQQGFIPHCSTYLNGHRWEDEYEN